MFRRLKTLGVSLRKQKRTRKVLTWVNDHIARQRHRIKRLKVGDEGPHIINPENMVWIFGSGRTGSTWLSGIMGSLPDHTRWHEPMVGYLFGQAYQQAEFRKDDRHFIFGGDRRVWLSSIRRFVLDQATARFPQRLAGGYLVVKEPHGSLGAPLLMEALPESRMVFLVRHPGDVVSSALDAHRSGSWAEVQGGKRKGPLAGKRPDRWADRFVNSRSRNYLRDVERVNQAYEAHTGRKVLVRYEDLKADTLGTMKHVYSALGMPVEARALARAVDKHAWENIPKEAQGEGRFYRKATPGAWREDLTSEQARIVEEVTRPLLEEFYP